MPASFAFLFIFSAFRGYEVGTDTYNYLDYYERLSSGEDWVRALAEPSWGLINDTAIYFFDDFRAVLIISTLLTLLPLYYVLYKYSKNPMFSLFIYLTSYFYLASLNITRQMMSASVALVAIMMLVKGRKYWFITFILISSLFHTSALFFLVLLFVNKLPDKDAMLITLSVISTIVGIFGVEIIVKAISLTPFGFYFQYFELRSMLGNLFYLILFNIFTIFIMQTTHIRDIYFKIFWLSIIITCLLVRIPFGDRISVSLNLFYLIFFPYYLSNAYIGNRNYKIIAVITIVSFFLYQLIDTIGDGEVFPYTNALF